MHRHGFWLDVSIFSAQARTRRDEAGQSQIIKDVYSSLLEHVMNCLSYSLFVHFFLSNDVINYCYHAMGEHVALQGAITHYEANQRALETRDIVIFFFPVCMITDRLIFSC